MRGAASLAQVAHQSGEFTHLVENLNYSAALSVTTTSRAYWARARAALGLTPGTNVV
jgi:predicted chitinase